MTPALACANSIRNEYITKMGTRRQEHHKNRMSAARKLVMAFCWILRVCVSMRGNCAPSGGMLSRSILGFLPFEMTAI